MYGGRDPGGGLLYVVRVFRKALSGFSVVPQRIRPSGAENFFDAFFGCFYGCEVILYRPVDKVIERVGVLSRDCQARSLRNLVSVIASVEPQ